MHQRHKTNLNKCMWRRPKVVPMDNKACVVFGLLIGPFFLGPFEELCRNIWSMFRLTGDEVDHSIQRNVGHAISLLSFVIGLLFTANTMFYTRSHMFYNTQSSGWRVRCTKLPLHIIKNECVTRRKLKSVVVILKNNKVVLHKMLLVWPNPWYILHLHFQLFPRKITVFGSKYFLLQYTSRPLVS